jgi:hypothetical protein
MLKPEVSIPVALTTGAIVLAIHSKATPTIGDVRSLDPSNRDLDAAERQATIMSFGIVGGISLIAKDMNVFIVGGGIALAVAWWHRYSNAYNPTTGMAATRGGRGDAAMKGATPRVTQTEAPALYAPAEAGISYDPIV